MHDIIIPTKINNDKDFDIAKSLINKLKSELKKITLEKDRVSKPLLLAISEERKRFAPTMQKYEGAISSLTKMLTEYQTAKIRAIEASQVSIVENHDDVTAITKLSELEEVDKSGFRKHQVLKICDLSFIPREYFILNEKLLLDDLKAGKTVKGAEVEVKYIPSGH